MQTPTGNIDGASSSFEQCGGVSLTAGRYGDLPTLGAMGAVLEFHGLHPSFTSYFQKGNWFVAFQGERGTTKAEVLARASLVHHRP